MQLHIIEMWIQFYFIFKQHHNSDENGDAALYSHPQSSRGVMDNATVLFGSSTLKFNASYINAADKS